MLTLVLVPLTLLCVVLLVQDLLSAHTVPRLEPELTPGEDVVSVIVPARDEATRIGRLLEGLVAQNTRDFELIVLDDNSTDGTGMLVERYQDDLPDLRLLKGKPLPPGWAGKCWACWQAVEHSRYEWLLFLDADTAPSPELIGTLLQYAMRSRIDLLSLLPFLELQSFWERLLMPPFTALINAVFPFEAVNDPRSSLALANGQCILVRKSAYLATGGHASVRSSVLEDVELARIVKHAGYKTRLVAGPALLRVRMYTNLAEVAEGLRKNAWAGYSAGGWRSAWGGVRQAFLAIVPWLVLVLGIVGIIANQPSAERLVLFGAAMVLITTMFWGYMGRQLFGLSLGWGLLFPLGMLGYFILAGIAWLNIRRGRGVQWKGRAYHS